MRLVSSNVVTDLERVIRSLDGYGVGIDVVPEVMDTLAGLLDELTYETQTRDDGSEQKLLAVHSELETLLDGFRVSLSKLLSDRVLPFCAELESDD